MIESITIPLSEAEKMFKIHNLITRIKTIIEKIAERDGLQAAPKIQTLRVQIKKYINELRFSTPLVYLEFEVLIGLETVEQLIEHLETGNVCPRRINLIEKHSGVEINKLPGETKLKDLLTYPNIYSLISDEEFMKKWTTHEINDNPKWNTYEIQ
jgi:hypothetical protein